MFEKALLLGMYAVSPLHPGSGSEISVIDLPVQREKHTGFPVVWGQSLKGALRHAYERKKGRDKAVIIFGPETNNASEHAGAISVGDARVLLFPVRSARGVFAYVTSPLVLRRFLDDLALVGSKSDIQVPGELKVHKENVITFKKSGTSYVVLEDVRLKVAPLNLSGIAGEISKITPFSKDELLKRLVIVPDDVFSAFVRVGTEVVARIRINPETGTVDEGALWYEEFIPRDTVMYSVIAVSKPKKEHRELKNAESIVNELENFVEEVNYLQIGGDETVGKGFVRLSLGEVNP